MAGPAKHPVTRASTTGTTVPGWERLIVLAFLIGPTIGVFWSPEAYFAGEDFSIKGAAAVEPIRGFSFGSTATYIELIWLIFVYARSPSIMINGLLRSAAPLAFGLIALMSSIWSPDLSASFNRGVRLVLAILMAIYLIERFTVQQIIAFLSFGIVVAVLMSFFAVILFPGYGLSSLTGYADAWRGAFSHKNALGAAMSVGVIIAFFAWRTSVLPPWLAISTLFAAVILLVQSRSATAGVAALIAIASMLPLIAIGNARRLEDKLLLGMAVLMCLLPLIAAISYVDDILLFIGRNPSLTGRTEIWQTVWSLIQQNPWIGYGHAFWAIDSPFRSALWTSFQWAVPHAHNTILDIWFQTGIFGLILAIYVIIITITRGIGSLFDGNDVVVTTFWLSILINLIARMFSETMLVEPGTIGAFWLALAYAGLTKMRYEQRVRHARRLQTARLGRDSVRV